MIKTCERCGGLYATENGEMFGGTPCGCGVPKGGECKRCGGNGRVEMLEHCPVCKGTGWESSIAGIIIPSRPPPGVVEALRNFVDSIEEYDRSGAWPDNDTLRRLADEGREALNCGHSSNEKGRPVGKPYSALTAPSGSAEYVRVRCLTCGWEDGLRADLAAAGQMGIYCDRCDGAQACELIPPARG